MGVIHSEWTTSEIVILSVVTACSSLLSLLGSTFVISTYRSRATQSTFHDYMVYVMACLNIPQAVFFGLGPLPEKLLSLHSEWFCKTQGFMVQLLGLMSVVWTCCLAHSLFAWLVWKKSLSSLRSYVSWYFFSTLSLPFSLALVLLAHNSYGPSGVWCWLSNTHSHFPFFWCEVLLAWLFNVLIFVSISRETQKRIGKKDRLFRVFNNKPTNTNNNTSNHNSSNLQQAISNKLSLYLFAFILNWVFGLVNRFVGVVHHHHVFGLTLLHCMFVPLQGWLNAMVFGSLHADALARIKQLLSPFGWGTMSSCWCCCCCLFLVPPRWLVGRRAATSHTPLLPDKIQRSSDLEGPMHQLPTHHHHHTVSSPTVSSSTSRDQLSMYVLTWNMGECVVTTDTVSQLLPINIRDFDVLAFGLQECLYLGSLKSELCSVLNATAGEGSHAAVSNAEAEYVMYAREIGSTQTWMGFHGHISLICFVKKVLLETGVVEQMDMATKTGVKRGMNILGLSRAPNKGAVGLTFRMFGSQVTFLSAHFAADTSGKSQLKKRILDSHAILRDLVADYDDVECDLHLCRHHTVFLGDLNFRLDTLAPHHVLDLVGQAFQTHEPTQQHFTLATSLGANEIRSAGGVSDPTALEKLLEADQLTRLMNDSTIFHGWREPRLSFPPTYRYVRNVPRLNYGDIAHLHELYSTKRVSGYPDRIIYHSLASPAHTTTTTTNNTHSDNDNSNNNNNKVQDHDGEGDLAVVQYHALPSLLVSDHVPVVASFTLSRDQNADFYMPRNPNVPTEWHTVRLTLSDISVQFVDPPPAPTQSKSKLPPTPLSSSSAAAITSLKLVFPLPHEDPFFEQRKILDFQNILETPASSASSASVGITGVEKTFTNIPLTSPPPTHHDATASSSSGVVVEVVSPVLLHTLHLLVQLNPSHTQCVFAINTHVTPPATHSSSHSGKNNNCTTTTTTTTTTIASPVTWAHESRYVCRGDLVQRGQLRGHVTVTITAQISLPSPSPAM